LRNHPITANDNRGLVGGSVRIRPHFALQPVPKMKLYHTATT
jgi:hypothetical protein